MKVSGSSHNSSKATRVAWRKSLIPGFVFFALQAASAAAFASDYRVGGAIGYGGAGLKEAVDVNGTATIVQRSEGPGMMTFWVEKLLSDTRTVAFEHQRGFRLAPFTSGVSFTGFVHRWYFFGPVPSEQMPQESGSTLLVRRYAPFLGVAAGMAFADISRTSDKVPHATGSGQYFGFKGGADYALGLGRGIRYELSYSMTMVSNAVEPQALSAFALQFGWWFYL